MIEIKDELINRINALKKHTFFEILETAGRVFIIVDYDESVVIGKRGFLPEEKQRGLVLVFNNKMNFAWDDEAITATLVFGNSPEKCFIPINAIAGIFSPDLRIQLTVPIFKKIENNEPQSLNQPEKEKGGKIINLNKMRKKK